MSLKPISYDDAVKLLFATLQKVSGLDKNRVRNIDSERGPELVKLVNQLETSAYDQDDTFILFELIENSDNSYITQQEEGVMGSLMNYDFNIHVYGKHCHMLAQQILALFRSESVNLPLHELGVWVKGETFPQNTKEFINDTLWIRCDITEKIMLLHNFEEVDILENNYFNEDTFDFTQVDSKLI